MLNSWTKDYRLYHIICLDHWQIMRMTAVNRKALTETLMMTFTAKVINCLWLFSLREKLLFAVNTNILVSYFGETWPKFIIDLEIPRIRCTGTGKYRIKLPALNRDGLEPSFLVDNMNSGLQRRVSLIPFVSSFLCGLSIPDMLLFLPRNDVGDCSAVINLCSLNSVFKRV